MLIELSAFLLSSKLAHFHLPRDRNLHVRNRAELRHRAHLLILLAVRPLIKKIMSRLLWSLSSQTKPFALLSSSLKHAYELVNSIDLAYPKYVYNDNN